MNFNAGNAQHIGARQEQQDSFAFSDPNDLDSVGHGGFLGIVADGMGGLSNGQEASSAAVRSFLAAYRAKTPAESIPDALTRSLMEANRAVVGITGASSSGEAGTTLVAAVALDEKIFWISAGDSRIYWLHDNELTRLTADHVYAALLNREVALGRSSRSEAQSHPERASLTSYLGQPEPALVDRNRKPLVLHEKESIILCSDGFYRGLSEEEIVSHFQDDPQLACDRLVDLLVAKQRKQQDNLTVIALKAKTTKHGLVSLSTAARVSLVAAVCVVLMLGAGAYWFRSHPFWRSAKSSAVTQAPSAAPVIVSTPPVVVLPAAPVLPAARLGVAAAKHAAPATPVHVDARDKQKGATTKKGGAQTTDHEPATPPAAGPAHPPPAAATDKSTPAGQQGKEEQAPGSKAVPATEPTDPNKPSVQSAPSSQSAPPGQSTPPAGQHEAPSPEPEHAQPPPAEASPAPPPHDSAFSRGDGVGAAATTLFIAKRVVEGAYAIND